MNATEIGVVLAVGLAAASLSGFASVAASRRFGRRKTLAGIGLLMGLCGLDLTFATQPVLLIVAGLTGMLGAAGTDLGPFVAVEQTVLAKTAAAKSRNRAFARYALSGALAGSLGALMAAAGTGPHATEVFFAVFGLLGLATAGVALLLSNGVEGERDAPVFTSFRPLIGLSALFALDSLGGGLAVSSVMVYWLHIKFGATPTVLGPTFAAMNLLGAVSYEASGRLADRLGRLNTMVFTHLPSDLLLILVPFAPSLAWAVAVLVLRSTISSMDQPARQALIVSIVKPNERSGAIAMTGALRGLALAVGPVVTGAAIQAAALSVPFIVGGTLQTVYDVGLFVGFRRKLMEWQEAARSIR